MELLAPAGLAGGPPGLRPGPGRTRLAWLVGPVWNARRNAKASPGNSVEAAVDYCHPPG